MDTRQGPAYVAAGPFAPGHAKYQNMTYGYNASFLIYTAKQDVRSIAAKLLTELADLRSGEKVSIYHTVFCCLPPCGISSAYLRHKAIT